MSIIIKELLSIDNVSQVIDKINFNFDQILLNGGGPPGIQGNRGPIGPIGGKGNRGSLIYKDTTLFPGINPNTEPILGLREYDSFIQSNGDVWEFNGEDWLITEVNLRGPDGEIADTFFSSFGASLNPRGRQVIYPRPFTGLLGSSNTNEGIPVFMIGGAITQDTLHPGSIGLSVLSDSLAQDLDSSKLSTFIHQKDNETNAIVFHGGPGETDYFEQNEISYLSNIKLDRDDVLVINVPKPLNPNLPNSNLIGLRVDTRRRSQQYNAGKNIIFNTGLEQNIPDNYNTPNSSDFIVNVNVTDNINPGIIQFNSLSELYTASLSIGAINLTNTTDKTGVILLEGNNIRSVASTEASLYSGERIILNAVNRIGLVSSNEIISESAEIIHQSNLISILPRDIVSVNYPGIQLNQTDNSVRLKGKISYTALNNDFIDADENAAILLNGDGWDADEPVILIEKDSITGPMVKFKSQDNNVIIYGDGITSISNNETPSATEGFKHYKDDLTNDENLRFSVDTDRTLIGNILNYRKTLVNYTLLDSNQGQFVLDDTIWNNGPYINVAVNLEETCGTYDQLPTGGLSNMKVQIPDGKFNGQHSFIRVIIPQAIYFNGTQLQRWPNNSSPISIEGHTVDDTDFNQIVSGNLPAASFDSINSAKAIELWADLIWEGETVKSNTTTGACDGNDDPVGYTECEFFRGWNVFSSGFIVRDSTTCQTFGDLPEPPDATYEVSSDADTVNEGETVTFTITTENVDNGTILYWANLGTSNIDDFENNFDFDSSIGNVVGEVTINNNLATVSFDISEDLTTEGSETIIFSLRSGSVSGTQLATKTVTINDTSEDPTNSVIPNKTSISENEMITFNISTQGFAENDIIYWRNIGTSTAADFSAADSGQVNLDALGDAVFTLTTVNDFVTEGIETLIIEISDQSNFSNILATSSTVSILDTSEDPDSSEEVSILVSAFNNQQVVCEYDTDLISSGDTIQTLYITQNNLAYTDENLQNLYTSAENQKWYLIITGNAENEMILLSDSGQVLDRVVCQTPATVSLYAFDTNRTTSSLACADATSKPYIQSDQIRLYYKDYGLGFLFPETQLYTNSSLNTAYSFGSDVYYQTARLIPSNIVYWIGTDGKYKGTLSCSEPIVSTYAVSYRSTGNIAADCAATSDFQTGYLSTPTNDIQIGTTIFYTTATGITFATPGQKVFRIDNQNYIVEIDSDGLVQFFGLCS